jgi:hypothetical protein
MRSPIVWFTAVLVLAAFADGAHAQGVREHTRPTPNRSTAVTESQATELTLTTTEVAVRPIQVWVRTAGAIDPSRKNVIALVPATDGALIKVGQRVRMFSPQSRSRMYQARISRVEPRGPQLAVTATLVGTGYENSLRYILEIVTERGEFLSVPNEAILETGGKQIVYVEQSDGSYGRREIAVGAQGELFTEVQEGLQPGERVVTIGSFFIDAEHKLKGS